MTDNHPLRISGISFESFVDGEGVRAAIFFSGCSHNCPGCHNPEAQNPEYGEPVTFDLTRKIAEEIDKRPFLSGITLTGGDPMYNPDAVKEFLITLTNPFMLSSKPNIWIYTGYTYEEIMDNPRMAHLLCYCDVLVDGCFEVMKANRALRFRGSSNQRIIDVKKSLQSGEAVLWKAKGADRNNDQQ